jgi:phosphoribosylformylglycinamidine (FGAM) synthase PurS component
LISRPPENRVFPPKGKAVAKERSVFPYQAIHQQDSKIFTFEIEENDRRQRRKQRKSGTLAA